MLCKVVTLCLVMQYDRGKVVGVHISPSMTVIKKSPAPAVAMFSSRGPSSLAPDILKVSSVCLYAFPK